MVYFNKAYSLCFQTLTLFPTFPSVLRIQPKALQMQNKCSTTELHPQFILSIFFFCPFNYCLSYLHYFCVKQLSHLLQFLTLDLLAPHCSGMQTFHPRFIQNSFFPPLLSYAFSTFKPLGRGGRRKREGGGRGKREALSDGIWAVKSPVIVDPVIPAARRQRWRSPVAHGPVILAKLANLRSQ